MKGRLSLLIIVIAVVILCNNCTPKIKMQFYNKYKKEINNEVFRKFEKHLPLSYDESLMAKIMYAPSFCILGCSGIDVLYGFSTPSFDNELQKVYDARIFSFNFYSDTLKIDSSHSEYLSIVYNQQKKAMPRVNEDFCRENDTCFNWDDLEVYILESGNGKVFSRNVNCEIKLDKKICNYSIGAFISKKKQHIIYWLLIYN